MTRETITREEFDKRLDAANAQHEKELLQREAKQKEIDQLLSQYERSLDEIENDLKSTEVSDVYPVRLRKRLHELAEKTLSVAASV